MYSLDINFLRDRPDYKPDLVKKAPGAKASPGPSQNQTPILAALGLTLVLNGIVLGAWFWLNSSNAQLQSQLDTLNNQQADLEAKVKEIDELNTKAREITADADALATVFNQIKPWSALYQEFVSKMPPGVKITDVEQKEPTAQEIAAVMPSPSPSESPSPPAEGAEASPSPEATEAAPAEVPAGPPPPTAMLIISGRANSFGEVNDFLLLLQRSPFLESKDTKLLTAQLTDNPDRLAYPEGREGPELPELKPIVEYKIETRLSQVGASEVLPDLKNKGAVGLVERIQILQNQGVIQQ